MGDTGDASFTSAILEGFDLVQRVQLPNWSDTAHELTVWDRKHKANMGMKRKKGKRQQSALQVGFPYLCTSIRSMPRGLQVSSVTNA